jgi:polyribonucleotide nucleotidyltransferase
MKKQQITKKENNIVIEDNWQRTKKFMVKNKIYSPKNIIENFANGMNENIWRGKPEDYRNEYLKVEMTLGLYTHFPIANSVSEKYRPFLVNIIEEIEKEYGCNTSIEKSLAQIIASSHVRIIHLSGILDNNLRIDKDGVNFISVISKELDRAQRQFLNAISTLRQIKMPSIPFNVIAKTAFVAQNQQINNFEKKNEINDQQ